MNSIIIKGRLTRDPELRYTQSNTPVASFAVAVDRRFTPEGQEKQADFIDCVAWRTTGENISKFFTKGKEIAVRGSLQSRKWEDRDGNKRISWEVIVDEFDFCGPKQDGQNGGFKVAGAPVDVQPPTPGEFAELQDDGELPF